jgi:hypothetical protein
MLHWWHSTILRSVFVDDPMVVIKANWDDSNPSTSAARI